MASANSGSRTMCKATSVTDQETKGEEKSDEYTANMQQAMGDAALVYRHEDGMNYAVVLPDLIVGSCPQKAEDVDRLRSEVKVGTILCLQQDSDLAYFGMEIGPIVDRVAEVPGMQHLRAEIRDFDPFSLRSVLPTAVAKLHKAVREGKGPVYVHCTAGLGRAPAVALAYMYWLQGYELNEANEKLQRVRRCSPKLDAIRAATCDLVSGSTTEQVTISWRNRGVVKSVEVAGLDVGWHNKLPLEYDMKQNAWTVTRELPVGVYNYKFIVDDKWVCSPDRPKTAPDKSGMVNNFVDVVGQSFNSPERALRQRLTSADAVLTEEDRRQIRRRLDELANALPSSET